jgi:hypothetical protein
VDLSFQARDFFVRSTRSTLPDLPGETRLQARQLYNIQHIYLRIGDQLETLLAPVDAARLSPAGAPGGAAALRLGLATAFQFAELLPDALAAEATLKRMDWKYALRLPVRHPGLSAEALDEFRQALFSFPAGMREFERLLDALAPTGLFPRSQSQALIAVHVLDEVCKITRLHWLNQYMRAGLSAVAAAAPDWMREHAQPHWYQHYRAPADAPALADAHQEARALGADARCLLSAEIPAAAPIPELADLQKLFNQQFSQDESGFHWRLPGCLGCARNH